MKKKRELSKVILHKPLLEELKMDERERLEKSTYLITRSSLTPSKNGNTEKKKRRKRGNK